MYLLYIFVRQKEKNLFVWYISIYFVFSTKSYWMDSNRSLSKLQSFSTHIQIKITSKFSCLLLKLKLNSQAVQKPISDVQTQNKILGFSVVSFGDGVRKPDVFIWKKGNPYKYFFLGVKFVVWHVL